MATLEEIRDRQKEVSGQLSAQVRSSALGLLGISWALLTAHDAPLTMMVSHVSQTLLVAMAGLAVAALFLDMLQYLAYTLNAMDAMRQADASPTREALYNSELRSYRYGPRLFIAKLVCILGGALLLLVSFFELVR